ncbi:transposase [Halomonas sp. HAL1]|nr:transposase [Halomonas sp. HAL1]
MTFRFVPSLSDTDLQTLMATYTYGVKPALRRRAHAIVLSHQGHTIDQICKILSVTRETVSLWFDAWEAQGLDGLRDKPRAGRPAIYSDAERERLLELVQEQPHQLKAVQARLQQETGKGACTMTLKRALKKSGV